MPRVTRSRLSATNGSANSASGRTRVAICHRITRENAPNRWPRLSGCDTTKISAFRKAITVALVPWIGSVLFGLAEDFVEILTRYAGIEKRPNETGGFAHTRQPLR